MLVTVLNIETVSVVHICVGRTYFFQFLVRFCSDLCREVRCSIGSLIKAGMI